MNFSKDGSGKAGIEGKVMQGNKIGGTLKTFMNRNNTSVEHARSFPKGILVLTLMHGSGTQVHAGQNR